MAGFSNLAGLPLNRIRILTLLVLAQHQTAIPYDTFVEELRPRLAPGENNVYRIMKEGVEPLVHSTPKCNGLRFW